MMVLECSSAGDRRFSALFARVTLAGQTRTIEEWYLLSKRWEGQPPPTSWRQAKGRRPDYLELPETAGCAGTAPAAQARYCAREVVMLSIVVGMPALVEQIRQRKVDAVLYQQLLVDGQKVDVCGFVDVRDGDTNPQVSGPDAITVDLWFREGQFPWATVRTG